MRMINLQKRETPQTMLKFGISRRRSELHFLTPCGGVKFVWPPLMATCRSPPHPIINERLLTVQPAHSCGSLMVEQWRKFLRYPNSGYSLYLLQIFKCGIYFFKYKKYIYINSKSIISPFMYNHDHITLHFSLTSSAPSNECGLILYKRRRSHLSC